MVPPIHSSSQIGQFRDVGKEQEVSIMACMMVHFREQILAISGSEKNHTVLMSQWRKGLLDNKLMSEAMAMRPDFEVKDLGFVLTQEQAMVKLPDSFDRSEEAEEQARRLTGLARALKAEQDLMRGHKAASQRHSTQALATECEFQKSVTDAVNNLWEEHKLFYQCMMAKSLAAAETLTQAAHSQLAGRMLISREDIPTLSFLNLPMLGAQASFHTKTLAAHVATQLNSMPSTSAYVIFPPNQPEARVGKVNKREKEKKIQIHRDLWFQELQSNSDLVVWRATGLFNIETMYSDDRDLGFEFWLVVASSVEAELARKNVFGASTLFRRKAVTNKLECMPRKDMANFCKLHTCAWARDTNRDLDVERKQWLSGAQLYAEILTAACQGTRLTAQNTLMIKDETMYDTELASAVQRMNAVKDRAWPKLAYVGVTWGVQASHKEAILANVEQAVAESVKGDIARGSYDLAPLPAGLQAGRPVSQQAPVLDMDKFQLSVPQQFELRWLQETLDKGCSCGEVALPDCEVWKNMSWADIKKKHEEEFNPEGKVGRKRAADTTTEEPLDWTLKANTMLAGRCFASLLSGCLRLQVATKEETSNVTLSSDLQDSGLEGMGRYQPAGVTTHEFWVSKQGDLYVKALAETVLDGPVFPVFGFFKTGPEAKSLEETGGLIPYSITPTSKVVPKAKAGTEMPACMRSFAEKPVAFQDILNKMTMASLPQPALHLHTIANEVNGSNVSWTVKALEPAGLKASVEEPGDDNKPFPSREINRLSLYTNLGKLTKVEMKFGLEFDPQANKFKGMFPMACTKQAYRIERGVIAKL